MKIILPSTITRPQGGTKKNPIGFKKYLCTEARNINFSLFAKTHPRRGPKKSSHKHPQGETKKKTQ